MGITVAKNVLKEIMSRSALVTNRNMDISQGARFTSQIKDAMIMNAIWSKPVKGLVKEVR